PRPSRRRRTASRRPPAAALAQAPGRARRRCRGRRPKTAESRDTRRPAAAPAHAAAAGPRREPGMPPPARRLPPTRSAGAGSFVGPPRFQVSLDRPYRLLGQHTFERRHLVDTVLRAAVAHRVLEVLVDLVEARLLLRFGGQRHAIAIEP